MAADKLDNRNRLLQQMGLIYNQIMELNEQMTDALQNAVDIDISVTGGVSDITKDFMEGFHYKIDEHFRVVSEQKKWEYDQLPPVKEPKSQKTQDTIDATQTQHQEQETKAPTEQETHRNETSQKEKHNTTIPPKYAALVYVKGSDKRTRVTGTSPEKIIKLCQKWNTERASDNQLGTAYIKIYNPETKAYDNYGKFDISKGVDLQPIYLELPPLGKQKFGQITSELKANGARFNPDLKTWYVTQACDLSLFEKYLPKQSEPQIDAKGQQDRKISVIDNLSQNKSHLDKNEHKGNQPHEQQRKQDAPAR